VLRDVDSSEGAIKVCAVVAGVLPDVDHILIRQVAEGGSDVFLTALDSVRELPSGRVWSLPKCGDNIALGVGPRTNHTGDVHI